MPACKPPRARFGSFSPAWKRLTKAVYTPSQPPLGPRQIAFGSKGCLTGVIARAEHPPPFAGLHDDLWAVHMACDDIDPLIDQAVGGLSFFDGQGPVTGKDDLRCRLRLCGPRPERESVNIAQHLRNRFSCDKPQLAAT